ncbi:RNA-guided endonuclease InsQ/TnpB family protein [Streptomyces rhizosphaericus]|uniref:RNA-guided endonuclease InsQ/TnpB family protein n=1 Tax=Streptomyces rhizosphaericus TaxID=114699 RepID=UPI003CD0A7E1
MTTYVKRAYRYRFSPTNAQAAELSRTFGCVRKVYNMALAARTEAWARQERVNYNQTSALLTQWKKTKELAYLNEVSSVPLQQALRHLQVAFTNLFGKRAKYPRFTSRENSRKSAEYTTSAFRFRDGKLTLAKMTEPLDIVWSRPLPESAKPSTVTVSQDPAGRWFVSLLVEDPLVQPLPANENAVGIDVGLSHLLALSTGEKVANPRHERRDHRRLALAQRRLAKKARGDGANRAKARRKVARIHARITDRRRDHLHKLTTRLVRENQTIAVDRFFPSSKLCSHCGTGTLAGKLPLNGRTWTCDCGMVHDRDVNAAKNLLAAGLAVSVCGTDVRPQRESSRMAQSAMKQKPHSASRRNPPPSGGRGSQPSEVCGSAVPSARDISSSTPRPSMSTSVSAPSRIRSSPACSQATSA